MRTVKLVLALSLLLTAPVFAQDSTPAAQQTPAVSFDFVAQLSDWFDDLINSFTSSDLAVETAASDDTTGQDDGGTGGSGSTTPDPNFAGEVIPNG